MSTSVSRRSSSSVHPTRQQLDDLDALLKRMLDLPVNRLEDESEEDDDASSSVVEEDQSASSAPEPMRAPHRPTFKRAPETEADLKPRVIIVAPDSPENVTDSAAFDTPQPPTEKPAGEQPEDWVPLTSSWRPSSRTWKPLTEAWQQAQGTNGIAAPVQEIETEKRGKGEEENRESPFVEPTARKQESINSPLPLFPSSPLPAVSVPSQQSRPTPPAPTPEWTPWYLWALIAFNMAFDVCLAPWGPTGRWLREPTGRALLGILGLLCLTAAAAWGAADWIGWTW